MPGNRSRIGSPSWKPRSAISKPGSKLNSTNSSKPPSSDPIGLKRKPPAPPSRRRRGGQPGHRQGASTPSSLPRSSAPRTTASPAPAGAAATRCTAMTPTPLIHQVAELPKIEPIVDEYRLHRLTCPDCGATTCGTLPEGVPTGSFGPYTQAVLATLAGAYRLSKRQIQQLAGDLFGLSISTGMISKLERQSAAALESPYNELAAVGPHGRGDPRRRDLVARGPAQGLAVGGGDGDDHRLHDRPQPQRPGGPGGAGDARTDSIAVTDRLELLRLDRRAQPADLLESSPPRFPGDDRPRRRGRTDRPEAVAAVGPAVPVVASPRGRESGSGALPHGDGPAEARSQGGPGGRSALRVRADARDLRRDPAGGGEPVDLRAGPRVCRRPTTRRSAPSGTR